MPDRELQLRCLWAAKVDTCKTAQDKTCGLPESRLVSPSFIKQVRFDHCTSFLQSCIINVAAETVASEARRAFFFITILNFLQPSKRWNEHEHVCAVHLEMHANGWRVSGLWCLFRHLDVCQSH